MEKTLDWVSEDLHLEFTSASFTCVTWGKPHNLLSVTFLQAKTNFGIQFLATHF